MPPTASLTFTRLEGRHVPTANFWAVAADVGGPGEVRLLEGDGTVRFAVTPFGHGFTGGVASAVGDVTADGVPDLVVGAGTGGGPAVVVYDGATGTELRRFYAFDPKFTGGLSVAVADLNHDTYADIVVGAGSGGGPAIKTFDGKTGVVIGSFFAYSPDFTGGVTVAAADLDGDDVAEVLTGAGAGGGPHVRTFRADGTAVQSYYAYAPDFRGGVLVAAGDLDRDGFADVVTGAGAGGGPHVKLFDGRTGANLGGFFAAAPSVTTGVGVGIRFRDDVGGAICAAVGGTVRDFDGQTFAALPGNTVAGSSIGGTSAADGDVVQDWTNTLLQAIWRTTTPPPQAGRILAITSLAMYDAVNSIVGGFEPYLAKIPAPAGASAEAAAAAAAARALTFLYPTRAAEFATKLTGSLAGIGATDQAKADGVTVGNAAAGALIAARRNDGASAVVPYTPGSAPGDYQPTPTKFRPSLAPQWPTVTPFALTRGDQFRPGPPPALGSAEYAVALNEVKAIGGTTSQVRTAEQATIGHFWADLPGDSVTPPGHWFEIALRVSRQAGLTLAENARMLALLGIAVADAGIVSWDAKYAYDLWRPVTAIHAADTDGNAATAADPTWLPLWETPNFQSYTSGHSTFSSAAATVLSAVFGADRPFTSSSDNLPGEVRSFASFRAAAEEAGKSRVYGGIHFEFDNQAGLSSGQQVGQYVLETMLRPTTS